VDDGIRNDKEIPPGHIGLSNVQRNWLLVALGEDVPVEPFDPLTTSPPMGMIDVVVLQVPWLHLISYHSPLASPSI
jgi:hypothetical protein